MKIAANVSHATNEMKVVNKANNEIISQVVIEGTY